ncbi:hypothetical protein DsansV1_C24g0184161 [Dioscorea sansibarensis]
MHRGPLRIGPWEASTLSSRRESALELPDMVGARAGVRELGK